MCFQKLNWNIPCVGHRYKKTRQGEFGEFHGCVWSLLGHFRRESHGFREQETISHALYNLWFVIFTNFSNLCSFYFCIHHNLKQTPSITDYFRFYFIHWNSCFEPACDLFVAPHVQHLCTMFSGTVIFSCHFASCCALSAKQGTSGFWHFLRILAAGEEMKGECRSDASHRNSTDKEREKGNVCFYRWSLTASCSQCSLPFSLNKTYCTGTMVQWWGYEYEMIRGGKRI